MRRILSQTRKELTQLIRDRRALGLALFLPVMQLMLMGSAISLTVADLPIVVQDLDNSPASRPLVDAFRQSNIFRIVPLPADKQPESTFIDNKARAALIVLDDIQWADSGTLDLLQHLARRGRRGGRIVLVTVRADERPAASPAGMLLADLNREGLLLDLPLAPLDRAACDQLLGHLLGAAEAALADDGDGFPVESRLVRVALLVVRREVAGRQLLAQIEDTVEGFAGVPGEPITFGQLIDAQRGHE